MNQLQQWNNFVHVEKYFKFSLYVLDVLGECLSDVEIRTKCSVAVLHRLGQSNLRFGLIAVPKITHCWCLDVIFDETPDEEVKCWHIKCSSEPALICSHIFWLTKPKTTLVTFTIQMSFYSKDGDSAAVARKWTATCYRETKFFSTCSKLFHCYYSFFLIKQIKL
jgi:hypothetical protein